MNNPSKQFPTSSLMGMRSFPLLFLMATISGIGILDFLTGFKVIGSATVSTFLLPLLPLFLLVKLTSKIRIEKDYVEKRTLAGRTRIRRNEIKAFGVYSQVARFVPKIVHESEVEENSLLANNVIFISTQTDFDPMNQNSRESITFEYREEIYSWVKESLEP